MIDRPARDKLAIAIRQVVDKEIALCDFRPAFRKFPSSDDPAIGRIIDLLNDEGFQFEMQTWVPLKDRNGARPASNTVRHNFYNRVLLFLGSDLEFEWPVEPPDPLWLRIINRILFAGFAGGLLLAFGAGIVEAIWHVNLKHLEEIGFISITPYLVVILIMNMIGLLSFIWRVSIVDRRRRWAGRESTDPMQMLWPFKRQEDLDAVIRPST